MDDVYEELVRFLQEKYSQLAFFDHAHILLYHASASPSLRPTDNRYDCAFYHQSELGYGFYCFPTFRQAELHRYYYIHRYLFHLEKFINDGGYTLVRGNDYTVKYFPSSIPVGRPCVLFERGYGKVTREAGQVLLRDGAVNYLERY